jgi:deazaflavin-dependent oxidoreductase (nitroreductase family)
MDIQTMNKKIIEEFRANNGKVGGPFAGGNLLILTTRGAKTGLTRVNPLAYLADGDRIIIIASYAGAPSSPPWYHNLVASPEVGVEVGTENFQATARVVDEPDRTPLYDQMAAAMPAFKDYQEKTPRVIPVIALTRN